jgi:hypothetical protein
MISHMVNGTFSPEMVPVQIGGTFIDVNGVFHVRRGNIKVPLPTAAAKHQAATSFYHFSNAITAIICIFILNCIQYNSMKLSRREINEHFYIL